MKTAASRLGRWFDKVIFLITVMQAGAIPPVFLCNFFESFRVDLE